MLGRKLHAIGAIGTQRRAKIDKVVYEEWDESNNDPRGKLGEAPPVSTHGKYHAQCCGHEYGWVSYRAIPIPSILPAITCFFFIYQ